MAAPKIIDLIENTPSYVYDTGRGGLSVKALVLHDTSGPRDNNSLPLEVAEFERGMTNTIKWLQGNSGKSVHYLIGPEKCKAPIFQLCKESNTAWHAGGKLPQFPATLQVNGVTYRNYQVNQVTIGIERWGSPNESLGENQRKNFLTLILDIAQRYQLKPENIVAHGELEDDRSDGFVLLAEARQCVANGYSLPTDLQPETRTIPFNLGGNWNAVLNPDGSLVLNSYTLRARFLHRFLTLDEAVSPPANLEEYLPLIDKAVHHYGLPISEHFQEGGQDKQAFEGYVMVLDERNPPEWKDSRELVGEFWLRNRR